VTRLAAIALAVVLALPSTARAWDWAGKDWALFGMAVGCNVVDIIATERVMSRGGTEHNPLVPKGAGPEYTIPLSAAFTTLVGFLADKDEPNRSFLLGTYSTVSCASAGWTASSAW
jgi:hypothetical protein